MATMTALPIGELQPNDWNPNELTDEEFSELVEEVRHLGRPPSPIVVRAGDGGYVIVDGEHNWRAAQQVGLGEVACEVIEADAFEAMRQTYKRNLHGSHNPVRLGLLFRRMMAARGLSRRSLAEEINVSEGTVRNALAYAEASDLRNGYASETGASRPRMEQLSVRQVRAYIALPPPVRDFWLDAGANLDHLHGVAHVSVGERRVSLTYDLEWFHQLVDAGLIATITRRGFAQSVGRAFQLLAWRREAPQHPHVDLDAYLRPVAELHLPADVIDRYLLAVPREDGEGIEIPLSPAQWEQILRDCVAQADDPATRNALLGASIERASLQAVGGEMGEQELAGDLPPEQDQDEAEESGRRLLRGLRFLGRERAEEGAPSGPEPEAGPEAAEMLPAAVAGAAPVGDIFLDRERLLNELVERLGERLAGAGAGEPAAELARERLSAIAWPELVLLGSLALGEPDAAAARWAEAIGREGAATA